MLVLYYENMNLPVTMCEAIYRGSSKNLTSNAINEFVIVQLFEYHSIVGSNIFVSEQTDQQYAKLTTIP